MSAPATHCLYTSSKPRTGAKWKMSYMMLEENPLLHTAAVQSAERVPMDYKAPLTGNYTVILTVKDMYVTDDLVLILLLWRPNL